MNRPEPHIPALRKWSLARRSLAVALALQLFLLPQLSTAQGILNIFDECGSTAAPILEEEVIKHACEIRIGIVPKNLSTTVQSFLHWYQDSMLDHPALEVPHQPPEAN
ncbi:MAG: hypothetical protein ABI599_12585 [Flavobacteriales bacterium]